MSNEIATVDSSPREKNMVDVEVARAVAQIQGSMAIAKKFPRDENMALEKIRSAAARKILAEQAEYEYTRGGSKVSGPSIRAAEAVAQAWGNMDTGVVEIRRDSEAGESLAMAYAVDLESNYWKHVTFSIPHTRDKTGGSVALTSSRDIYERVMNDGSRRLRNCILAVIPGDVMDLFMDECNKTLSKNMAPLHDRIPLMLSALEEFEVTRAVVELKFGCKAEALSDRQISQLRRIYQSLKDGFGTVSDHFGTAGQPEGPARVKATVPKPKSAKSSDDVQKTKQEQPKGAFDSAPGGHIKAPLTRDQLTEAILIAGEAMEEDFDQVTARITKRFGKPPMEITNAELEIMLKEMNAMNGVTQ